MWTTLWLVLFGVLGTALAAVAATLVYWAGIERWASTTLAGWVAETLGIECRDLFRKLLFVIDHAVTAARTVSKATFQAVRNPREPMSRMSEAVGRNRWMRSLSRRLVRVFANRSRAVRWPLRFALLVLSTISSLLLAELAARVLFSPYDAVVKTEVGRLEIPRLEGDVLGNVLTSTPDPELPYICGRSSLDLRHFGWFATNRLGLRDYDRYCKKKPPNTNRILLIGDSIAMGVSVPVDQSLAKLMELELNSPGESILRRMAFEPTRGPASAVSVFWNHAMERFHTVCSSPPDGPLATEVLNGGVMGYGVREIARWLESYGLPLEPDIVIYCYCLNDRSEGVTPVIHLLPTGRGSTIVYYQANYPFVWDLGEGLNRRMLTECRLWAFLQRGLAAIEERRGRADSVRHLMFGNETSASLVQRISRACAAANCSLYVVVFPYLDSFSPYRWEHEHRWIEEQCRRLSIKHLDLLASYTRRTALELNALDEEGRPDGVHPNALGYKMAAQEIIEMLRRDGALKMRRGR